MDRYGKIRISVGEMMNGNAFELALALTKYGFEVPEIYSNVDSNDFVFIRRLAEISPDTRLFTNLSPTMMYYDCSKAETDLTIGVDDKILSDEMLLLAAQNRPDVGQIFSNNILYCTLFYHSNAWKTLCYGV